MRAWPGLLALIGALNVQAQQGWLPLSRTIDAPATTRMHAWKAPGHSAVRPYLREDLVLLKDPDTAAHAVFPWLDRITDPARRWSGGPLLDLQGGLAAGESDPVKYRAGGGGWLTWNAGERWTLHADAQGWMQTQPAYLAQASARTGFVQGEGRVHDQGDGVAHYDWNAYADYKAGKYFHLTLGRGKHFFGEGHRSLFLSDEATSYPYLKITTTAWRIRYVNLYALMDDARDPARIGKKFTSMHYLSWNASPRINIGVFEAIVWQDQDPAYPRGFDINYVNPVVLYRPVEFGLGSPDNALLGLALNVKVGRKALLYGQLMFDEFLLSNMREGRGWYGNKQGFQLGVVGHDAFKVKGLQLRAEFDYVRPFMYTHVDPRQNHAHAGQPLAHPYGSGFWEGIGQAIWRDDRWLLELTASYSFMGQDTTAAPYGSQGNDIFRSDGDRPRRDGIRPEHYGYFIGSTGPMGLFHNELAISRVLEPRSGLMLQLAWTARMVMPENGPSNTTNWVRAGIVTNLRDRHSAQMRRSAF